MIKLVNNALYNHKKTIDGLCKFVKKTNQLTMGDKCKEFEETFSKHIGVNYSVLCNSGASANLVLLQALKNLNLIKEGDKVGFTAITWSTNVMPIMQMGFNPVPIDIDAEYLNNTTETLKDEIKDIKVMFITNVLGFTGDLKEIQKLCAENGVLLIEDNCESFGTEYVGQKTGTFGFASTHSFYVAHHISTIEGGMISTDNEILDTALRVTRANGWDRNLSKDFQDAFRGAYNITDEHKARYTFYDLAYNVRPTEITGYLGCEQIKYADEIIKKRERNYLRFKKAIQRNDDIITIKDDHLTTKSIFSIPLLFKTKEKKKEYQDRFERAGIEIRPIIAGNIVNQPFYKKYVKESKELKGANFIENNGFYFGNPPDATEDEIRQKLNCLEPYPYYKNWEDW